MEEEQRITKSEKCCTTKEKNRVYVPGVVLALKISDMSIVRNAEVIIGAIPLLVKPKGSATIPALKTNNALAAGQYTRKNMDKTML